MCGIIAIVRRKSQRTVPQPSEVLALVDLAMRCLQNLPTNLKSTSQLQQATSHLNQANQLLDGIAGLRLLLSDKVLRERVYQTIAEVHNLIENIQHSTKNTNHLTLEAANAALIKLKDAAWSISNDKLQTAEAVANFSGYAPSKAAISAFWSIQVALAALDRLEIRGRDSAGLHLLIQNHGLNVTEPAIADVLQQRSNDPSFQSRSVRWVEGHLSFVYKTAAEIGELGDNTKALRAAISNDTFLKAALANEDASVVVLGHTRWASVGTINEANAHPLNSELTTQLHSANQPHTPYAVAALNGDVDNHANLSSQNSLSIHPAITTDAKVIPTLWACRLAAYGTPLSLQNVVNAFRETANELHGSVAVAAQTATHPNHMMLALRGSGQALYVGASEDAYVVASEPYGLVEQCSSYLRMDGETPAHPNHPADSSGQIVVLNLHEAGNLHTAQRLSYSGTPLPITQADIATTEITTRDLDRRGYRHYLLKEISESQESVRKTLRGRLISTPQSVPPSGNSQNQLEPALTVLFGTDTLPETLCQKLASGKITKIVTIGQGTAAVAGQALAYFLRQELPQIHVSGLTAAELSGFGLSDDMANTLVIAISQSGTTTDTNRTVDLAKRRGALVIGIVNRRNSELCEKADGVLYTSDGRDVEMSVASTKAFYAQVTAGVLLAVGLANIINGATPVDASSTNDAANAARQLRRQKLLATLAALPTQMAEVLESQNHIAEVVRRRGLGRTYWAVVGNGLNQIAAEEVRIKLSELCYKSISSDSTEDKKHIDLSSEPLILVCACGLSDSNAEDVAKEVAIFKAHRAMPIVVTNPSQAHLYQTVEVLSAPTTQCPELAFVLTTMVGHLFGYESALAINELAQPLRATRAVIQDALSKNLHTANIQTLNTSLEPLAQKFLNDLNEGCYNGCLQASTAVAVANLYHFAIGKTPLDTYQISSNTIDTISTVQAVLENFLTCLTVAIDELTRPIDAIRHQAKTVTVGITRR